MSSAYRCWLVGCNQIGAVDSFLPSVWDFVSVDPTTGLPIELSVDSQEIDAKRMAVGVAVEFLVRLDDSYGLLVMNFDLIEGAGSSSRRIGKVQLLKDVNWSESAIGRLYQEKLLLKAHQSLTAKIRELEIANAAVIEITAHK